MAQNEMRAMRGMPLRVRSMEGLGTRFTLRSKFDFTFNFDRYVKWKLGHADGAA